MSLFFQCPVHCCEMHIERIGDIPYGLSILPASFDLFFFCKNYMEAGKLGLVIIDEAHRLKYQSLEELRDLQERWNVGIVLIGDPGMEMNLPRMFHFADRVRYAEPFGPLSGPEIHEYIQKQAENIHVPESSAEVKEVIATCTRGNPRTLGHLFALIQKILKINDDIVQEITPEVIEAARELMLTGSTVKPIHPSLANAV